MMRTNGRREDKVKIGNEEAEDVEGFVYLGAIVIKDGGGTEDIKNRLNKARGAFLMTIWKPQNKREEAGQIPVYVFEEDPMNMVATTCPKR